ncbi:hypothetical protein [Nocardia wallacei]|uniref:hypothetical protein n=1 Tax=Nocardia wallacei TaxID=480035 RepID=UPI00245438EE|nr:hypothetical protein [Nocardia wallacei]
MAARFGVGVVYDITPGDESKWIRLRDNGTGTTLAVEEITSDAIDGTREIEVSVDDFEATNTLLEMLGFTAKSYQETQRVRFTLDGAQLELDTWPRIPPYLKSKQLPRPTMNCVQCNTTHRRDEGFVAGREQLMP